MQVDFSDLERIKASEESKAGEEREVKKSPVDWSEYSEVEPAKPGDKVEAVVVDILKGKLGEFLNPEQLEKWRGDPSQPCIQVVVEGKAQGYVVRESRILTLPQDKKIRKNSNLYKWKKLFGDYPSVGQRVFLIADSEGYFRLTL